MDNIFHNMGSDLIYLRPKSLWNSRDGYGNPQSHLCNASDITMRLHTYAINNCQHASVPARNWMFTRTLTTLDDNTIVEDQYEYTWVKA